MQSMFKGAANFNQPLTTFSTSKVSNMWQMFQGASSFNGEVPFDTAQVTSMDYMFDGAANFKQSRFIV